MLINKGLSPFTDERTPSFVVSPAKQIWKDFSSGKGGTVITFLMEHEQYSYPDAIRYIADKYKIEVEEHNEPVNKYLKIMRRKVYFKLMNLQKSILKNSYFLMKVKLLPTHI